ncbi:MAG: hypothetical protein GX621_17435, partial [Pirellulaceae bacterium]|nr:hypothetical protein [Pirellulaceae bacterium]
GDWDGPHAIWGSVGTSTFNDGGTSGDGEYGGEFAFNFSLLLPGDANRNGFVYDDDYAIVFANLGMMSGATWEDGDFDGDADVDEDDLAIYSANYFAFHWAPALRVKWVEVANSGVAGSTIAIPTAAGEDSQLLPLPAHDGVNQVILTFNEVVGSSTGELLDALTLTDNRGLGTEYTPTSISVSPDGKTVTWTFDTTFQVGQFVMNLSDEIVNFFGGRLDGEWDGPKYIGDTSGTSQFFTDQTSGDGKVGGDFTFAFSLVLPGDANRDGRVDMLDFAYLQHNYNTYGGTTWEMGDFNGDGNVNMTDMSIWGNYFGWKYWPAPGVPTTYFGTAVDQVFQQYGFGNDDPDDDIEPDDPEWDDFVDDLFEALQFV